MKKTRPVLNKRLSAWWLVLLALFFNQQVLSSVLNDYQDELELDFPPDEQAYEEAFQAYEHFLSNPLDINTARQEDLLQLPSMTPDVAAALVAYREQHGRFASLGELTSVPGLDASLYDRLKPLLYVEDNTAIYRLRALSVQRKAHQTAADSRESMAGFAYRDKNSRAAMVLLQQPLADAYYDQTGNVLRAAQIDKARPEQAYFAVESKQASYILGSYTIGFGERLTLDNSNRQSPSGWSKVASPSRDWLAGQIHSKPHFDGLVASYFCQRCRFTQMDVYASSRQLDLYQYDLRYAPDASASRMLGECEKPGSSRYQYHCDDSLQWYTNRLLATDTEDSLAYQTLNDVVREDLYGLHLQQALSRNWLVDWMAYRSRLRWLLEAPGLHFSPAAPYPNRDYLAAQGFNIRYQAPGRSWSWAASRAQGGLASLMWWRSFSARHRLQAGWRYYSPHYINPHGRGYAASDETLGSRRRNEAGGQLKYWRRRQAWQFSGLIDVWVTPYVLVEERQKEEWRRRHSPSWNRLIRQQVSYQFPRQSRLLMSVKYSRRYRQSLSRAEQTRQWSLRGAGVHNWNRFQVRLHATAARVRLTEQQAREARLGLQWRWSYAKHARLSLKANRCLQTGDSGLLADQPAQYWQLGYSLKRKTLGEVEFWLGQSTYHRSDGVQRYQHAMLAAKVLL